MAKVNAYVGSTSVIPILKKSTFMVNTEQWGEKDVT